MADVKSVCKTWRFESEALTLDFARTLSNLVQPGRVITLQGALGVGKTAIARHMLQTLMRKESGAADPVPSPTFALVFSYRFEHMTVHHFDLYRVDDPGELELIGIRDYFDRGSCCLIEWPERGLGVLPNADIDIKVSVEGGVESLPIPPTANQRQIQLTIREDLGDLLQELGSG